MRYLCAPNTGYVQINGILFYIIRRLCIKRLSTIQPVNKRNVLNFLSKQNTKARLILDMYEYGAIINNTLSRRE